jgi:hypothetical protein
MPHGYKCGLVRTEKHHRTRNGSQMIGSVKAKNLGDF